MLRTSANQRALKIIWAVDPSTGTQLRRTAVAAIKRLTKKRRATVEPIYVMTNFLDSTPSQTAGDAVAITRAAARKRLAETPGITGLGNLKPLTVLSGFNQSMRRKTAQLIEYAQTEGADLIVVASHGRNRIEKWFLGSFADSLMRQSAIPVLIVNPHGKGSPSLKRILFPTDFSPESQHAFKRIVEFARASRLPITIIHSLSLALDPAEKLMLTHRYDYKRSIRVALAEQRAIATRWALEAKRHGVKAAVFIDAHPVKSVADSILRYQRRRGGIIALSSRGNDSPPLLIGGTTRAVAQGSTSAVWVLYPLAKPGSAIHRPTTDPENTDLPTAA